jgi:hypothetical protein
MKLTLEIRMDGNLRLPFSANVESLADLSKLGRVLVNTPRKITRLLPDLKDAKITGVKIATE